ncbi:MAG: gliding motility-associated C-terminal domain-containing protein [Flavobacteriaceae bacterium]
MKQLHLSLLYFFALFLVCGKAEAQPTIIIDPSFNTGTGFTAFNSSVESIALQPDGKILAGGRFTTFNGTTRNRLVRLNSDGTLDTSFNIGTGFNDYVFSVILQPDGKILVGGYFTAFNGTAQNRIARLNPNGTLDTSFNIGTGFNEWVNVITLQPDGKILIGGVFTTFNGTAQNRLVRLNSNGTLDTSFDLGTGFSYAVASIALQPDGKILVGGFFATFNGTTQNTITRLHSDGTLDTSFNIGIWGGVNGYSVRSIALQPDGKILVGGNFTTFNGTTQNRITRLNSDGTLDTSFNTGTGFSDSGVNSIVLQPDGKILVGGSFPSFNGTNQSQIVRLNPNGTLDTCFITGGGFYGGDYASWVESIALQPDGKILVGGFFTKYNGTTQNRITRLQELVCEIIPPTPTVEVYHPNCYSPTESGNIIVTNPLGNQYQYSINGIDYQENTDFNNLPPGTYQVTVKEGCCISEPLEVVINFAPIFPEPLEVEVVQPTCNNPYGSIEVLTFTFPAGTYSINGGEDYQYSPMFENLLPGTYQVIFKSGYGICVTEIMEVTINPVPTVPTPQATLIPIICSLIPEDAGTLVVTYPLGDEYEYSIGGVNYQSSPVFPNVWGFETFELTVRQGDCISEPLEFSNFEQSTVPEADVMQPDCTDIPESGQLGAITVTFPLGDLFQYSIDGENYQDSPVFENLLPDTYQLTFRYYESEFCVSDPFEVSIFALDIPEIPTAIITQPTCDNPFGSIEVTSPLMDFPPYMYSINGEDYQVSPFFENLSPGIYQLTAQLLTGGCPSEPLEVNIHFPPVIPETPTVIILQPDCHNLFGSIEVVSPVDEGHEFTPNYEYSINGVDYYEFTVFENLSSGFYYVTVRHLMSGCVSESVEVIIDELPEIAINLIAICENENRFVLKAETEENYQYVWNTGETTPVIEIDRTGTYSVIVSLDNCSEEFFIDVDAIPCMIPKGISPNGDFLNDEFDLSGFGTVNKLEIFNRYGKSVYSQSNYTNQWKGQTNNGKELPSGTYYYNIIFQNGTAKTGWVYLNKE